MKRVRVISLAGVVAYLPTLATSLRVHQPKRRPN